MTGITFSIVICNHDYGRFVGEPIQSRLDQDYPKALFEVIVVDDGSSDESREVIGSFASQPNFTTVLHGNRRQSQRRGLRPQPRCGCAPARAGDGNAADGAARGPRSRSRTPSTRTGNRKR